MNKNLLIVVGLVIIVVVIASALSAGNKPAPTPVSDGNSAGLIVGDNAIYVAEQAPGQSASVGVARLAQPGFVVIHEDQAGAPGAILGQSGLLAAGESENVSITLTRATQDQETLYAMIHLDNGDGSFDPAQDVPATDSTGGGPVMMMFTVSIEASEPAAVSL